MSNLIPEIERKLTSAIEKTIIALRNDYPNDNFYYFTLSTGGEALTPGHSIWSEELLEKEAKKQAEENNDDYMSIKEELKFSPVESPLFYHYERYFKKVEDLFSKRPNIHELNDENFDKEFNLRIDTMVKSLKNADKKGAFGINEERKRWFINVQILPPDSSNLIRAKIFNSEKKVQEWLDWGGE